LTGEKKKSFSLNS